MMSRAEKDVATPSPWRLSPRSAAAVALGLALVAVTLDWFLPADIFIPVVYGLPLVACAWTRDLRFLWGVALGLIVMTLAVSLWGAPPLGPYNPQALAINRILSAAKIITVAAVVHLWVRSRRALEAQQAALTRQNEVLDALNQELMLREEEVIRQNEEIQSQAEELERQSEELRVTNEELAVREKMLEQLLELSRSLTVELDRGEMMKRICEALGFLMSGQGSAILEKHGDNLHVVCHHGFGPDGPDVEVLPYGQSIASLVLARGQTGYVEDLRLRPDLRIPQPRSGAPFTSVLATPLRIRGRAVGTIEIYDRQRPAWSEAQVAMLESLAVQASVSLSSAELIEAIQQERRRFESVFRTVPVGLLVADDPEGCRLRINPAGAALFNVAPGDHVVPAGLPMPSFVRALARDDRPLPPSEFPLARALRGETVYGEELEVVLSSGRRLVLLVGAAPLHDTRGRIDSAVASFADVTALKILQRELEMRRREAEEASVRKTRFLAAVSHDIRTPANAINLMAELICRVAASTALASQVPELAQKLKANTLALVELVSDVLDVARFDSGKIELQESEFSLGELLAAEARQILPLAQDKNLELIVEPLERPIWLRTDRVKLGRVLGNLLSNAIKFTERGTVRVSAVLTADPERRVLIRVSDTGPGIAPEHHARIFDEFAQLRNPARDASQGTGLGLAICKRLIEVLGGTISVESQLGRGSTFTVTLPAAAVLLRVDTLPPAPEPALAAAGAARGQALAGLRVLLVEDHHATREGTARILLAEGAEVLEAADGQTALRLIQEGQFDVALLDMMLPDLDGRELLKTLQAQRPARLKAVFVLTGDLTPERLAEIQHLGADALIEKPIDVDKLVSTLRGFQAPAAEA
jgi:signal transduction histidine kinase/ActR/RegA family two-component response regulator